MLIGHAELELIGIFVIVTLMLTPVAPYIWKLVFLSRSTRSFIAKATPLRELNDKERAALAFMGSRTIGFIHLVGTTVLPLNELEHVHGRDAAVYQLRGPLKISGYISQWGGEVQYSIQNVQVFMAKDCVTDFATADNIVEVIFSKNVGVILTCIDNYSLNDVSTELQMRL